MIRTGRALAQFATVVSYRHHAVLLANHGPIVSGTSLSAAQDAIEELANHGPIVSGTSLSAAQDAIEELEATAKLFLLLRHERVRLLTTEQVARLRSRA